MEGLYVKIGETLLSENEITEKKIIIVVSILCLESTMVVKTKNI